MLSVLLKKSLTKSMLLVYEFSPDKIARERRKY